LKKNQAKFKGQESVELYLKWANIVMDNVRLSSGSAGDELVSLGFRVGNPSAMGWHQERIFQRPCYREALTSRRNRDPQFAPKNGRKPKPSGWPAYTSSARKEGAKPSSAAG
jgi:hypothetical protein